MCSFPTALRKKLDEMDPCIDSVDQLEILRVLASDSQKDWPAEELGQVTQVPPKLLPQRLDDLEASGLLTVRRAPNPLYRYGLASSELELLLARLIRLYNKRPGTVIRAIRAGERSPLHYLADLFQLRKK